MPSLVHEFNQPCTIAQILRFKFDISIVQEKTIMLTYKNSKCRHPPPPNRMMQYTSAKCILLESVLLIFPQTSSHTLLRNVTLTGVHKYRLPRRKEFCRTGSKQVHKYLNQLPDTNEIILCKLFILKCYNLALGSAFLQQQQQHVMAQRLKKFFISVTQ